MTLPLGATPAWRRSESPVASHEPAASSASAGPVPTDADVTAFMAAKQTERDAALKALGHAPPPAGARVTPEDLSLRTSRFRMVADNSESSLAFAEQMCRFGQEFGFRVLLMVRPEHEAAVAELRATRGLTNLDVVVTAVRAEPWREDPVQTSLSGELTIAPNVDLAALSRGVADGRRTRFPGQQPLLVSVGYVAGRGAQRGVVAEALALRQRARLGLAYLEGGNVVPGVGPAGRPFALVGRDSVAGTRGVLEADLARLRGAPAQLTDEDVRAAIGHDLGLPASSVVPVEQAAAMHLDMALTLIGPAVVALNDSAQSLELTMRWSRDEHRAREPVLPSPASDHDIYVHHARHSEWQTAGVKLEARLAFAQQQLPGKVELETRAAEDLQRAGFHVVRVGGTPSIGDRQLNLFNCVKGTAPDGRRFMLLLGMPPVADAFFRGWIESQPTLQGVHVRAFDPDISAESLQAQGGAKCRTQPEGSL